MWLLNVTDVCTVVATSEVAVAMGPAYVSTCYILEEDKHATGCTAMLVAREIQTLRLTRPDEVRSTGLGRVKF